MVVPSRSAGRYRGASTGSVRRLHPRHEDGHRLRADDLTLVREALAPSLGDGTDQPGVVGRDDPHGAVALRVELGPGGHEGFEPAAIQCVVDVGPEIDE